jgi:hypothetical protein
MIKILVHPNSGSRPTYGWPAIWCGGSAGLGKGGFHLSSDVGFTALGGWCGVEAVTKGISPFYLRQVPGGKHARFHLQAITGHSVPLGTTLFRPAQTSPGNCGFWRTACSLAQSEPRSLQMVARSQRWGAPAKFDFRHLPLCVRGVAPQGGAPKRFSADPEATRHWPGADVGAPAPGLYQMCPSTRTRLRLATEFSPRARGSSSNREG